jgi:phosphoribosyl 1,2-cyclic phosphodiesterase
MTCNVIATGSSGNAVLLNRSVLIDCGVPFKLLKPYIRDLKLVLLTHRHGDHFREAAVRRLAQERPLLRWGMCGWMLPLVKGMISPRQIDALTPEKWYALGRLLVSPVVLVHDVPNCGYRFKAGNEKAFYATDTGTLEGIRADGYDLYMVEANYEKEELEAREKEKRDKGEFSYEYRAASNHLSQEQAEDWLVKNARPYSKIVCLHQHKEKE